MKSTAFQVLALVVCVSTFPLFAIDIGMRLAMWDDGVESASGQVAIELPEQGSCIPVSWLTMYPSLLSRGSGDCSMALRTPTGKFDREGHPLLAWHDYVYGTNPMDTNDIFKATIAIENSEVNISWMPRLSAEEENMRTYTIYGKTNLADSIWHSPTNEASRFFKVGVEMR